MPDATPADGVPEAPRRKWDAVSVVPCGCGGGVHVVIDGETLNAEDVDHLITGTVAMSFGPAPSVDALVTEATGQPRAARRKVNRRNAMTRRILRDQAIRHLHDRRGLSVRAVAADLRVGRGSVSRALTAAGRNRTRRDIERLRVDGYAVQPTPLDAIRGILRGEQERAA